MVSRGSGGSSGSFGEAVSQVVYFPAQPVDVATLSFSQLPGCCENFAGDAGTSKGDLFSGQSELAHLKAPALLIQELHLEGEIQRLSLRSR